MTLLDATLAEGRSWSRVGDAYEVTRKPRRLDVGVHSHVPFLPMDAVPQGGAFQPEISSKPPADIASGTYFERGDLLVAKITPSFENGKQALVRDLSLPFGYATTEVIPLRPRSPEHDPRLLFFYLLHPDVRHHIAERMEGSTGRQRVPERVLLDLPIPAFDDEEERAIGAALEAVRAAGLAEEACHAAAVALKGAALRQLFSKGLRGEPSKESELGPVPQSWDVVPLGALGRVGNGSTPKRSNPTYWSSGTFPWLTSAKIYDRDIVAADEFVTEAALRECHLPPVEPGSVLIAITGQGKTLGHCAILRTRATISQHLAYVATDLRRADPVFLRGYIEGQYEYLRQVGAGGGSTKGALTCAFLRSLPVPLPSTLDEQREVADVLNALDAKIDLHRRKRERLDELFHALLHKLMTGEIGVGNLDLSALQPLERERAV